MPSTDTLVCPTQESSILLALALPLRIINRVSIAGLSIKFRLDRVSYVSIYIQLNTDNVLVLLADFLSNVRVCQPPSITGILDVQTAVVLAVICCPLTVKVR